MIGCIIPVSILINVPSITSAWVGVSTYNETTQDWVTKELSIPRWLDAMIILALVMAIVCNICVLFRFLERHVWHYLHRTPHFRLQGSGVTHKQRLLIAEAMSLCFYLAIGALIVIYIEDWTFLDALFFVMVTITTIGFGDKVPESTGGRVFVVLYAAGGIVLLALVVNSIRYVILEDLHRRFAIRAKERKAKREARRMERREQRAREEESRMRLQVTLERIRQMESAAGVGDSHANHSSSQDTQNYSRYFTHFPLQFHISSTPHLRLPAVFSRGQEHTASDSASEGRTPGSQDVRSSESTLGDKTHPESDSEYKLEAPGETNVDTHRTQGRITIQDHQQVVRQTASCFNAEDDLLRYATMEPHPPHDHKSIWYRFLPFKKKIAAVPMHIRTPEEQREADKRQAYKETMDEYQARLRLSALMFLTFWLVGAVIFTFVESWDFGSSMYFVVVAFTTIGYGDFVPKTIAGRSIFLAYCLLGVVTLTSLASLIAEVLSKRMRRHVVESQLRRVEQLEALEDEQDEGLEDDDLFLEGGMMEDSTSEDGPEHGRVQVLSSLVEAGPEEHLVTTPADDSCRGSLRQLVNVSKQFDQLLQKVLGLDYFESDNGHPAHGAGSEGLNPLPSTPGAIVDFLEKEEDASDKYLSPSISRDIISTSSIHRHSVRPFLHPHKHITDTHSGTFHGTTSNSVIDSSQIKITAWPTTADSKSAAHPLDTGRRLSTSPAPSLPAAMTTSSPLSHRHNRNGTITIPAIHWQHLIEYSKQFKTLTQVCEEALEKVAAWEASERKLRQKRFQTRCRQKRLLESRRRQLEHLEATRMGDDDEEELEELDDWDEEGSNDDEEDEVLDQRRSGISNLLLGPRRKSNRRSQSRGRRSRRPSVPQDDNVQDQSGHSQVPPPQSLPTSLASQLQARLKRQGRPGHRHRRKSRSRSRVRDPRPHNSDEDEDEDEDEDDGHEGDAVSRRRTAQSRTVPTGMNDNNVPPITVSSPQPEEQDHSQTPRTPFAEPQYAAAIKSSPPPSP
ncbi:hypothetical protein EDD11_002439 [Mortierella claussenii]|nr:hypothetical protein EDD11_002439 [Mortierella claussenii]